MAWGLKIGTGAGKTTSGNRAIKQAAVEHSLDYYEPTLAKCDEQLQALTATGIEAMVERGFSADDPDWLDRSITDLDLQPFHTPGLMCLQADAVKVAAGAGVDIGKELCASCPFAGRCGMHVQKDKLVHVRAGGGVIIKTHNRLGYNSAAGQARIVVFDEDPKVHGSLHSRPAVPGGTPHYYVGTLAVADGAARIVGRTEQGAWTDLSKVGGYNSSAFEPWRFANFGLKVLAVQRSTRLQVSDGDLGTFRDVNANIKGSDVETVRGFAVLIEIQDSTHGEGSQPFRVWWSAIGDAENWPDPTSDEAINVQSGFFDLFGGGRLQRIVPGIGGADAIIVAERKMWRMTFVGPAQTFQFDEIESDQGTSTPGSVVKKNETFFFFGHNGFYHFDGANSTPIGQGIMDEFYDNDIELSSTFGFQSAIEAGLDSENKNYVISYRSEAATDDRNDRVIRFNWLTGEFSNSALSVDTLAQVDNFTSATDAPRLSMVDSTFQIVRPEGDPLEATLQTAELTSDRGIYGQVQGVLPYCDTDAIVAQIAVRDRLSDDSPVLTAERSIQLDGFIRWFDQQPTGRFYQCRFRIPAGSDWTFISGMLLEFQNHSAGPRIRA